MIIKSKNVWFEEKFIPLQIEITNDIISAVYDYNEKKEVDVDYGNAYIIPGLVDIHCHGYNGNDSNHATLNWLKQWSEYLPSEGVTSYMPSISSAPIEDILESLEIIADYMDIPQPGAEVLGIYSEGPFVSVKHHGGQNLKYRQVPTIELFEKMQLKAKYNIKRVMVAPEEEGVLEFIKYLIDNNVLVSIGHSGALYEDCVKAVNLGANSFTHTFNAMTPLHHREAGAVGAAMTLDNTYAELIGDGIHVNKVAAKILATTKGKDKLISVTDSSILKGYACGEYEVLNRKVYVTDEGVCRLENGGLSGSCAKICDILKYEILSAGIDMVTAINSVTINPLKLLGIHNKGLIKKGFIADICIMDNEFSIIDTYVKGNKYL